MPVCVPVPALTANGRGLTEPLFPPRIRARARKAPAARQRRDGARTNRVGQISFRRWGSWDALQAQILFSPPLCYFLEGEQDTGFEWMMEPEEPKSPDAGTAGPGPTLREMLRWVEDNVNERLIFERLLLRLARTAIMAGQD